jgi:hypothetical protein
MFHFANFNGYTEPALVPALRNPEWFWAALSTKFRDAEDLEECPVKHEYGAAVLSSEEYSTKLLPEDVKSAVRETGGGVCFLRKQTPANTSIVFYRKSSKEVLLYVKWYAA